MGGKNTSTTSSYAPNPQAQGIYNDITSRAQNVASTPYQAYSGQMVAPLSGTQNTGIQNVNNAYGVANPYISQASQYGASGAAPVSNINQNDIQQYMNPYQQSVIQSTLANIGENNAQQQQQVLGNAAQRGALGGDRVGVAQAELARQQNLATNQTLAGLNSQNYSQALQTAQGQQQNQQANAQRQAQAAYTFGNLGTTAQNTALQGAGAQLTAGGLQQQTQQAQDTAAYQQFMQQQAFPYQQTSWLAGINTPIAGSMGGTQTQTPPSPSPWSQGIGAGLGVAGLFLKDGGRVGYADGGGSPFDFINNSLGYVPKSAPIAVNKSQVGNLNAVNPNTALNTSAIGGLGKLRGIMNGFGGVDDPSEYGTIGGTNPMGGGSGGALYADGGLVSAVHAIRRGLMNKADGGPVPTSDYEGEKPHWQRALNSAGLPASWDDVKYGQYPIGVAAVARNAMRHADGGPVDSFKDRWGDFPVSDGGQPFGNMQAARAGMAQALQPDPAVAAWRNDTPMQPDVAQPAEQQPQMAAAQPTIAQPETPLSFGQLPDDTTELSAQSRQNPMAAQSGPQRSGLLNLTDEQRQGLLAAGLGMLGGTSPFAGVNIGQGGLKGVEAMSQFRKEQQARLDKAEQLAIQRQSVSQRGQQLAQQAEQFAKTFGETQRQHNVTQMQPVKIGTDALGREIYGIRDPATGSIKILDPKTGQFKQPETSPTSGLQNGPSLSEEEGGIPAAARPVQGSGLRNETYLKELTEQDKDIPVGLIKKVADYDINPATLSNKGGHRERILNWVSNYDPSYSQATYPARAAAVKEFTAGGSASPAGQITAGNTAIQHAAEISDAAEKMRSLPGVLQNVGNKGIPFVSYVANQLQNAKVKGTPEGEALKEFKSARDHFAEEVTKFYSGSQGSEAERDRALKNLDEAGSIQELRAAINQEAKLIQSKVNALQERWKNQLGGDIGIQTQMRKMGINDYQVIQKKSQEALDKIHTRYGNRGTPEGGATNNQQSSPAQKLSPSDRYNQLISGGMNKTDAYKKMHEEGY